jgi:hypothetical protein
MPEQLQLGCTASRHRQIGIDAIINARGGLQFLNEQTMRDIELMRDGAGIRAHQKRRIRWYGPNSRFFRKHRARIEHMIARYDD